MTQNDQCVYNNVRCDEVLGEVGFGLGTITSSVAAKTRDLLNQGLSSSAALSPDERRKELRAERLSGTRQAGRLLPAEKRVFGCYRFGAFGSTGVKLEGVAGKDGLRAGYRGLFQCSSVWACPSCAALIGAGRAGELKAAVARHLATGGKIMLLTLTTRHTRAERLGELLSAFRAAQRSFKQGRAWKALNAGLLGSVTATEATWSTRNGWHPHLHVLLFLEGGGGPDAAKLTEAWLGALRKQGLDGVSGVALDLQDGEAAASYLAKWGIDKEMARGDAKHGGGAGFAPFEILRASHLAGLSVEERAAWGCLFVEYYRAFKGKKQLTWSQGLKVALGVGEVEDEEIVGSEVVEAEKAGRVVFALRIPFPIWLALVALRAEVAVLGLVESGRFDDVHSLFERVAGLVVENTRRGVRYNWAGKLVPMGDRGMLFDYCFIKSKENQKKPIYGVF